MCGEGTGCLCGKEGAGTVLSKEASGLRFTPTNSDPLARLSSCIFHKKNTFHFYFLHLYFDVFVICL
jgi:hypothetical protein